MLCQESNYQVMYVIFSVVSNNFLKHKKDSCVSKISVFFSSPIMHDIIFFNFFITLTSNKCINLKSYNDKVLMHKLIFNNKN